MDPHHTPSSSYLPAVHPLTALLKILNDDKLPLGIVRTLAFNKKLSASTCEKQARAFGFSAKMFSLRFASIPCETVPLILETERGDGFLILKEKIDAKSARVILSDGRESVISTDLLSNVYTGRCLFLQGGTTLSERFKRVKSTIREGWARYKSGMIAAMGLNLIFATIVIFTGRNSDALLAQLDTGRALMPLYASILAGMMAIAYSLIRPGLIQRASENGNWFFRNAGPVLGRREFAALVDFPSALIFTCVAAIIGGFAAIPVLGVGAIVLFVFIASRHIEHQNEPAGASSGSVIRSLFVVTAILASILSANQQITTGEMIGTIIFSAVAMQLLFSSRSLVQRSKLIFFLRAPRREQAVYVMGGDPAMDKGFEFRGVSSVKETDPATGTIDFSMETGERIALFGPPQSGKTNLFRMMLGYARAERGAIFLNGIPFDEIPDGEREDMVGHLGQDAPILKGTLRSNVELGNRLASEAQLKEALRSAGLAHLLDPEAGRGLDTLIGNGGVGLTVLERRCLCLARALVRRPRILLLDEPAASLDAEQAEQFYERVDRYLKERADRSLIIATSKIILPPLLKRVLVLQKGSVIADGPVSEIGKSIALEEDLPTSFSRLLAS